MMWNCTSVIVFRQHKSYARLSHIQSGRCFLFKYRATLPSAKCHCRGSSASVGEYYCRDRLALFLIYDLVEYWALIFGEQSIATEPD